MAPDPTPAADLSTHSADAAPVDQPEALSPEDLRRLQQRSDAKGLVRLAIHLAIMGGSAWAWIAYMHDWRIAVPAVVLYGFTLATMFAAMHETVHRTAFRSGRLNDTVAWFAGLFSFYNSTFYRHYHGWHHRFTQIPGRDPELDDPKPTGWWSYLVELSAVTWWIGKVRTHVRIALGRTAKHPYITEKARASVVRSVRLQLLVYVIAIGVSVGLHEPWFVWLWLLPLAVGQPLLRAILLAEHTGCATTDDAMSNTRTTYTVLPVRVLMWDMPYHAEHHRYPALPFHALAEAHAQLKPRLAHVATGGYTGMHRGLIASFRRTPGAAP